MDVSIYPCYLNIRAGLFVFSSFYYLSVDIRDEYRHRVAELYD